MYKVGKTFPPHRQVLKDISLSFFLGAKIGIIGLNGSGKSTLLKIIAGMEKNTRVRLPFYRVIQSVIFHRTLYSMKPGPSGKLLKRG